MQDRQLIHQYDELLYPDIIFNRPISNLARLQIAVFGGRHHQLAEISQLYQALGAMGVSAQLYLEEKVIVPDMVPLGTFHLTTDLKKGKVSQTAEVLDRVGESNLAIFAPNVLLGSAMHILAERLLTETDVPIILTDEAVMLMSPQFAQTLRHRGNVIFFLSNRGMIQLANQLGLAVQIRSGRGVYNTLDIQESIFEATGASIISYAHDVAVVLDDSKNSTEAGIIHFSRPGLLDAQRGVFLAILAGLVVDLGSEITNFMQKALTGGYLFQKIADTTDAHVSNVFTADRISSILRKELS